MKSLLNKLNRRFLSKMLPLMLLVLTTIEAQPQSTDILKNLKGVQAAQNDYVPGEVLVQYKSYVAPAAAANHTQNAGNTLVRTLQNTSTNTGPTQLVKIRAGINEAQAIAEYSKNPDVAYAQPNYIYHITAVPNDTKYSAGEMWSLKNTGQTVTGSWYTTNNPGTSGKDINAETAWNTITDCSSAVVAVVDTGVNYNHEDLSTNMATGTYNCPLASTGTVGCDFVGAGSNNPMDLQGHGTHVAGTIGARGNNALGVTGICQIAKILAVRVLDASGSGTTADIVEGVNFAAGIGAGFGNAKVINMSLGGPAYDLAFNTALTTAKTNGVVVVVAAGNSSQDHSVWNQKSYPCDYNLDTQAIPQPLDNLVCIAAVDQKYAIATFSDFDTNATVANRNVDIGAPGTNIMSSFAGAETVINESFTSGWNYSTLGGSQWGHSLCNIGGYLYDTLNIPNSCGVFSFSSNYVVTTNSTAYKSFTIPAAADKVWLDFVYVMFTESGYDFFSSKYTNTGIDPMPAGTSILSTSGYNVMVSSTPLTSCIGSATCSVGFKMTSDSTVNYSGVGVVGFSLSTLDINTLNVYAVENGTSMASPHVAGIATMVRARNPNFTYTDTVNAILTGGDLEPSMTAGTKTGMVADAFGSLQYIPEPTGVVLGP